MEFERIADKKRLNFIRRSLLEFIPTKSSVLDVGCGNGIITTAIGKMGFFVTGIDSSEASIALARSANNLPNVNFFVDTAVDFVPGTEKFDAIICSEVLEHLDHPSSLLTKLHSSLKANGILVVTVPNGWGPRELLVTRPVQYLQGKNNLAWRMVFKIKRTLGYPGTTVQSSATDLRHIQFFTFAALRKLAKSTGFVIVSVGKANFIEQVFPFSLLFKRSSTLQRFDCWLADRLPASLTSGFMTVWKKL